MRFTRLMTALLGVLAALAMTVGLAPARATPSTDANTAAKTKHNVTALSAGTVNSSTGYHWVKATIPSAKGKMINVQVSRGCTKSNYRSVASKRTKRDSGWVKIYFHARACHHVRLRIPETRRHKTTFPYVGKVRAQRGTPRLTH